MSAVTTTPRLTKRLTGAGVGVAVAASTVLVAAPAAEAKPAKVTTAYTCDTALGPQTMKVTVRLNLPAKVKKGKKVAARPVRLDVVLPEELVGGMRFLGITAISGSATKIFYTAGAKRVPLRGVNIPKTTVPQSGTMTLKAKGKAGAFKAPKKKGRLVIRAPKNFVFNAKNQNGDPVPSSPFTCTLAKGAPTKLGVVKVVK